MLEWINVIVQGVLVGGLYAMFAAGLSLIFGIMRLVNIAHGDLIVLAAYLALVTTQALGIGPFAALLIVTPLMGLIGYGLQRLVLNDVFPGVDGTPSMCDGIAEDWFDSPEAMQAAFASAEGQAVAADAAQFLDLNRMQLLVVAETEVPLPAKVAG